MSTVTPEQSNQNLWAQDPGFSVFKAFPQVTLKHRRLKITALTKKKLQLQCGLGLTNHTQTESGYLCLNPVP